MNFYSILLVGGGGFLGSIARYITTQSIDKKLNAIFPYGTIMVNVVGSFILGVVAGAMANKTGLSPNWKLFLGTGFCGGFTTFSAFAYENVNLLQQNLLLTSILYIAASLVVGLLALWVGLAVGKAF